MIISFRGNNWNQRDQLGDDGSLDEGNTSVDKEKQGD